MLALVLVLLSLALHGVIACTDAAIIRVPEEQPTIQVGLDSSADGDTILVALGIYAEALTAPPHMFMLKGDVVPDTGEYPRPTVDPSSLPGSDSLTCLQLPVLSRAIIEDFKFRNGPEMFPRPTYRDGGISSRATMLTLRRCLMDTLYKGVTQYNPWGDTLIAEHSMFRGDTGWCFYSNGTVCLLSDCVFSGAGSYLARVGPGSQILFCHFEDYGTAGNPMLQPYGSNILVENCVFGPDEVPGHGWMLLVSGMSGTIRNNVFFDSIIQTALYLSMHDGDAITVEGNLFIGLQPSNPQSGSPILVVPQDTSGISLRIRDNTISECSAWSAPNGIDVNWPSGTTSIERNHFQQLTPSSNAAFDDSVEWGLSDSVTLRNNSFEDVGLAARGPSNLDARWNWWGNATGPYHSLRHPEGQGEEVQGALMFDPWLTDSNITSVPELLPMLPDKFTLAVYPNPFNPEARLRLTVPEPGRYRMELCDVTGRKVRDMFEGAVVIDREIVLSASDLPSGVYFARAIQSQTRRTVATAKLVLLR